MHSERGAATPGRAAARAGEPVAQCPGLLTVWLVAEMLGGFQLEPTRSPPDVQSRKSTVPLQTFSSAVSDLVVRAAPSVVAIHSHRSRSSGFMWRPGLIVTADEALADEGEISVTLPGG